MANVHRRGGKLYRQFHLIFIRVKRLGFSCVLNCPLIFFNFIFFYIYIFYIFFILDSSFSLMKMNVINRLIPIGNCLLRKWKILLNVVGFGDCWM